MGSSFANLHVLATGADIADLIDQVVTALDAVMGRRGYLRSEGDAVAPGRSVLIGADGGQRWLSVLDEGADSMADVGAIEDLAVTITADSGLTAVAGLAFDSDFAWLGLFRAGRLAAEFAVGAEALDGTWAPTAPIDPSLWADLLGNHDPSELGAIWSDSDPESPFAEERIALTGLVIGLGPERSTSGYRYAKPDQVSLGLRSLAYVPDGSMTSPDDDEDPFANATGLILGLERLQLVAQVGEPVRVLVTTMNAGPPIEDLSVAVAGSAIADGLVQFDEVRLQTLGLERSVRATMKLEVAVDGRTSARFDGVGLTTWTPQWAAGVLSNDPSAAGGTAVIELTGTATRRGTGRLVLSVADSGHPPAADDAPDSTAEMTVIIQ